MKEFVLIFRTTPMEFTPTPEQAQQMMTGWMNWMKALKATVSFLTVEQAWHFKFKSCKAKQRCNQRSFYRDKRIY